MESIWDRLGDHLQVLGSAILFGGVIGLERQLRGEWAGLRTHIIATMGAALFVHVSVTVKTDVADLSRVIQGVASGIGFIGAGTILKLTNRLEVRGLTTASSLWLAAALGVACGMRLYVLAAVTVILTIFVLFILRRVEILYPTSDESRTVESDKDKPHKLSEKTAIK